MIHKLYHTEVCALKSGRVGGQKKKTPARESNGGHVDLIGKPEKERKKRTHNSTSSSSSFPAREQVHSNLCPLLAAVESRRAFYLVFPFMRFTLFDIAVHSPAMFNDSVSKPLFVLFQLLKVLEHCHKVGIALGPLTMHSVFVDSRLWVQVRLPADVLRLTHDSSVKVREGTVEDRQRGQGRGRERSGVESKTDGKERGKMWRSGKDIERKVAWRR